MTKHRLHPIGRGRSKKAIQYPKIPSPAPPRLVSLFPIESQEDDDSPKFELAPFETDSVPLRTLRCSLGRENGNRFAHNIFLSGSSFFVVCLSVQEKQQDKEISHLSVRPSVPSPIPSTFHCVPPIFFPQRRARPLRPTDCRRPFWQ